MFFYGLLANVMCVRRSLTSPTWSRGVGDGNSTSKKLDRIVAKNRRSIDVILRRSPHLVFKFSTAGKLGISRLGFPRSSSPSLAARDARGNLVQAHGVKELGHKLITVGECLEDPREN